MYTLILIGIAALFVISTLLFFISRYRTCPSNKVLVIYGKVGAEKSAKVIHGGGNFIWPVIQNYGYLELTPMTIDINLRNALSKQNIRLNIPSRFTIPTLNSFKTFAMPLCSSVFPTPPIKVISPNLTCFKAWV